MDSRFDGLEPLYGSYAPRVCVTSIGTRVDRRGLEAPVKPEGMGVQAI